MIVIAIITQYDHDEESIHRYYSTVMDMKHFHIPYLFWKMQSLQHVTRRCANIKSEYGVVDTCNRRLP